MRARTLSSLGPHSNLRERMRQCGCWSKWANNTWYCRTVACPTCRASYAKRQKTALIERYASAYKSEMSLLTAMFGVVAEPSQIGPLWNQARKAMRYRITRLRDESRRWRGLDLSGYLEVDAFTAEEIPLLGSDQRELVSSLDVPLLTDPTTPLWMPHLHAIVHHPGLAWQDVNIEFAKRWPAPYQIDVQPFYDWQDKDVSIEKITSYSLKYQPAKEFGHGLRLWRGSWLNSYYEWAFGYSRSFQSFKFSISGSSYQPATANFTGGIEGPV